MIEANNGEQYEVLKFYNDSVTLHYSPALHAYYTYDGTNKVYVPNVTTILGMIEKPALQQWAANATVEYLTENVPKQSRYIDLDGLTGDWILVEKLKAMFNDARFNFRKISKTAKDIGSEAHEWLDLYNQELMQGITTLGADPPRPLPEDEKARRCVLSALEWKLKHKFRPVFAERKVYSRIFNYAGTFDWNGYVTSCGDPKCCPFTGEAFCKGDYKSSKAIYNEYRMQGAAYKYAWEEEFPDMPIEAFIVLRLGKEDGEFEPLTVLASDLEADFDGFLGTLQMYNWHKQLELNARYEKLLSKPPKKARKPSRRPVIKELVDIPVEV